MNISGHQIEFGYEAIAMWPYAYWAHRHGILESTESGPDTSCMFWYSPKHTERTDERKWENMKVADKKLPNLWIHKPRLDKSQWEPPPLKDHFKDSAITFEKPTVVIANRVNSEWNRGLINYFDLPTLRSLFTALRDKYSVVYINIMGRPELEDSAKAVDIGDYAMIRSEFPEVRIIHDIVGDGSYNETQCRIFAGCERFITMNGGLSILASYFGGENIIYTKECMEINRNVNSFYNWYPDLGGSAITVVRSYDELLRSVTDKWVDDKPLLNILLRCHNREESLKRLHKSIESQDYKNYRVIASYDNEDTWKYLMGYPYEKHRTSPQQRPETRPDGDEFKGFLPSNNYLNEMAQRVTSGYIMYIDDDDYFAPGAFRKIARGLSPYHVTVWRAVTEGGRKIPSDDNWKSIVAGDISGIAFAFHHRHKDVAQWTPWRRGDYRVIKALSEHMKVHWIDSCLSIIGRSLPEKNTKDYIERKKAEHKLKVDMINATVAAKMLEKKNAR